MAAIDSAGTIITIDGTTVGGARSFGGLGSGSPAERDRTTFEDTNFRRMAPGLRDGGTVTVGLLIDSDNQGQRLCYKAWKDATRHTFAITYRNGVVQSFGGYVFQFPQSGAPDSDIAGDMQLRVDGEVTGFPAPA